MFGRITVRRTLAILRKELHHIFRNLINLFLVAIAPAFLLLTLGYVFSLDVEHVDLAVLDYDRSELSRAYINRIAAGETFSVVATPADYDALDALLVAGKVDAGLVIPPDFGEKLAAWQPVAVQAMVDSVNAWSGWSILGKIQSASAAVVPKLVGAPGGSLPFEVRGRAWYNVNLESQVSVIPGLLAIVLTMPALALSLSLAREKELRTLEGLVATPMHGGEYLLGKMGAYMLVGIAGVLLSWAVAVWWFHVPFNGSLGVLLALTIVYYFAAMGFSLLTATWLKSQQTALFTIMMVFFVPSFFLTGLIFPVDYSKPGAVLLATLLPATHYIIIARGIFLKGVGVDVLRQPVTILLVGGGLSLLVGVVAFKKRV